MSEWKVKTVDQLPDHLQRRLDLLPAYLTTKRATEETGEGRSKLYEAAAAGEVRAIKSGATTLWETLSLMIRLANLPAAQISTPSPRRKPFSPTPSHPPGSRRARRQPISASSRKSVPQVASPPVQPEALPPSGER
jgi:hypothetical protein